MSFPRQLSDQAYTAPQARISRAIERMKSPYYGEAGFADIVRLGGQTIPSLRALLFAREPSGLYEARRRAAEALAALRAFDVLAEFLRQSRVAVDPIERLGDEAVINAAAQSLARLREERVYRLLAELAQRWRLRGVLVGLGSFLRKETIPLFIAALREDDLRPTAEAVLLMFGGSPKPMLVMTALARSDRNPESESHLRQRRSALALLRAVGASRKSWGHLCPLMDDNDHQIALLACAICASIGTKDDRTHALLRLRELRLTADWLERDLIDQTQSRLREVENVGVPLVDNGAPQTVH